MSYNNIAKKTNELQKRKLIEFLNLNERRLLTGNTVRERSVFESNIINFEERMKELKESLNKKTSFTELTLEDLEADSQYLLMRQRESVVAEELYIENRLKYENALAYEKQKIKSKLKEIKAKINILKGANSNYSFVFRESFVNYYNIDSYNNNIEMLNVDIESELATLPEIERRRVEINSIYIGSKSNGIPGNEAGEHKDILNILLSNKSRFEYFKYGDSSLSLDLHLKFKQTDVVNEIIIDKTEISNSSSLLIRDIVFELEDSNTISIKKLTHPSLQSFEIDSIEGSRLKIKMLPIKCKAATISFVSKDYSIKNDEKIYSFGIQRLFFNKVKYSSRGEIRSERVAFPKLMQSLDMHCLSWPNLKQLDIEASINTDSYSKSQEVKLVNNKLVTVELDGSDNFAYQAIIKKDNIDLKKLDAYKLRENYFSGQYTSKIFNKDLSPNLFKIPREVRNIKVLQYGLCRRSSNEEEKITLGYLNKSGVSKFVLPLFMKDLFDEIKIFINNEIVSTQVFDLNEVVDESKFFIKDSKYLYVYSSQNILKEVGYLIKEKKGVLIREQEGFYISINENFDFTKNNINIYSVEKNLSEEIALEKNTSKFSLKENINSFSLTKLVGGNWVEADVNEYSLNLNTGILRVSESIEALEKRLSYVYEGKHLVKNFDIWKKDEAIKGIFIKESDINIEEVKKEISIDNVNFFKLNSTNIIKKSINFEEDIFSETEVEEVPYINGKQEFKNIQKVERDIIPAFEISGGAISFYTLNDIYKLDGFENRVKVYNDKDEVVNNLTISISDNNISISGLTESRIENWYLEYYTLSEEELGFRYSVNYDTGIVYLSEIKSFNNKKVYYQVGNVEVEYDICKSITNLNYSSKTGTIELFLEETSNFNSKIKIIWEEETSLKNLNQLKEFYSPLIYELSFGVN